MSTEERAVTEQCEQHGPYEAKCQEIMGRSFTTACPTCAAEKESAAEAAMAREIRAAKERRIKELAGGAAIPKRFTDYGFDDYAPPNAKAEKILAACRRYAAGFEERFSMGGGLVLCGKPGTGKTHIACAIANHVIREHKRTALFTSITKMARKIKATYGPKAEQTEDQAIQGFVVPDLLIIDEVGAQRGTETELLLAQEVIDERYQQVKPTILISNLSESELAQYIGERALDRMYEGGGAVFAFDWDSFRRSGVKKSYEQSPAMEFSVSDRMVLEMNGVLQ